MIGSFPFASTGKCNSMVELFTSTGRDFDSTVTIKCNASTGEEYCEPTGKCNSMVELLTLTGRDLDFTIKLSASTGKEYCVSTGECNSKVKLVTSTGIDLDNIRENLPALVQNKRTVSFDKCVYSFSILFYDVPIHEI